MEFILEIEIHSEHSIAQMHAKCLLHCIIYLHTACSTLMTWFYCVFINIFCQHHVKFNGYLANLLNGISDTLCRAD